MLTQTVLPFTPDVTEAAVAAQAGSALCGEPVQALGLAGVVDEALPMRRSGPAAIVVSGCRSLS